jgi:hypothetical protein
MHLERSRQVGAAFENKGKAKGRSNAHGRDLEISYRGD